MATQIPSNDLTGGSFTSGGLTNPSNGNVSNGSATAMPASPRSATGDGPPLVASPAPPAVPVAPTQAATVQPATSPLSAGQPLPAKLPVAVPLAAVPLAPTPTPTPLIAAPRAGAPVAAVPVAAVPTVAAVPAAQRPAAVALRAEAQPATVRASEPSASMAELPDDGEVHWTREWIRMTPSWLASMVVHMIVLLGMALWFTPLPVNEDVELVATTNQETELVDLTSDELKPIESPVLDSSEMPEQSEDIEFAPEQSFADVSTDLSAQSVMEVSPLGSELAPQGSLIGRIATGADLGGLSGVRGGPNKGDMIRRGGGNDASEAAVARALKWIASQQMADGGWNFDLRRSPNPSANPGTASRARAGATAIALLPFLGAGHTHKEGKYKQHVQKGLYYLVSHMKPVNTRFGPAGSLLEPEGSMYSHGLASIVLCEAYAMTRDKALQGPAQASLNFICHAQAADGGWRYEVGQPGDTSVVGWQVMALKSGVMGYLNVPAQAFKRSSDFLDKVQADSGAFYGYLGPGKGSATTSIGLLCRMFFGWNKENPALIRGVEFLAKTGPSTGKKANIYYNYYATQVMRHWEGPEWDKWNKTMRDYLIETQATRGPELGSWYVDDPSDHGGKGQRLYVTALSTMILEVYYRHLPIFQKNSTDTEFMP